MSFYLHRIALPPDAWNGENPNHRHAFRQDHQPFHPEWRSFEPRHTFYVNSFNHYSYGAIGDWLYRSAVGIKEAAPGYKKIVIQPHTGDGFDHMQASTLTPYGKVATGWTAETNVLKTLDVEIPVNTNAEVLVPASGADRVKNENNLPPDGYENGYAKFVVGSGKYRFIVE